MASQPGREELAARYAAEFERARVEKFTLTNSALIAHGDGIRCIASDRVDLGREHFVWCERLAELAIRVKGWHARRRLDPETALDELSKRIEFSRWVLEGHADPEAQDRRLNALRAILPAPHEFRRDEREIDTWFFVLPFLIMGDPAEAYGVFRHIHRDRNIDPKRTAFNAKSVVRTIGLLLYYLNGHPELKEAAFDTMEMHHFNITGWGHEGKSPRDHMWDQLVPEEHVTFARIRARFVTGEEDPIRIIQSIRGL